MDFLSIFIRSLLSIHHAKKIVVALLTDLNNLFSLDLDTDPDFTRKKLQNTPGKGKGPLLSVLAWQAAPADEFAERGYEVIRICRPR
jgi:hypothetical protein